jgi:photosystem II stability/assembly factor-like uncharacterized protein
VDLLVGTDKGLFRFTSADRRRWESLGPVLEGLPIYSAAANSVDGTWYAGVSSPFYGPSIRRSRDRGRTWDAGGKGLQYDADDAQQVTRVWAIRPATAARLYAGVEASGLFRSDDGGDTWREVRALRRHPTHDAWGAGNGGACLHTVVVDPHVPDRLYTACSTGGVYRTDDGGETWRPLNRNIVCRFLPEGEQYPDAGQCVHKVSASSARPGRLWLQNHGGVYRSDDGGESWQDVGHGLPADFGFPIVAHSTDPERAFVIPLGSDGVRWMADRRLAVYGTDDGGSTWRALDTGVPGPVYTAVLRDAFAGDREARQGLYFGTTSGTLLASADEGAHWTVVAEHLPRILCVAPVSA